MSFSAFFTMSFVIAEAKAAGSLGFDPSSSNA
jgi:hypothetical protein